MLYLYNFNFHEMKLFSLILLFILGFVSCKKNDAIISDPIPEPLISTWICEITGEDEVPDQLFRYVFVKEDEYYGLMEWYWYANISESQELIAVMAAKAIFFVQDNKILPTITHWGSQLFEFEDDVVFDEIVWNTIGDVGCDMFDMGEKLSILFEFEDGQLIVKEDLNSDGDFDDEEEKTCFNKREWTHFIRRGL